MRQNKNTEGRILLVLSTSNSVIYLKFMIQELCWLMNSENTKSIYFNLISSESYLCRTMKKDDS